MPLILAVVLLVIACKCTHLVISPSHMADQVQLFSAEPTNQFNNHLKDYQSCFLSENISLTAGKMKQVLPSKVADWISIV